MASISKWNSGRVNFRRIHCFYIVIKCIFQYIVTDTMRHTIKTDEVFYMIALMFRLNVLYSLARLNLSVSHGG